MPIDLNEAICIYLGADEAGGYNPIGDKEQRLKDRYGQDYQHVASAISGYLSWNCPVPSDRPFYEPGEETQFFRERLRATFPELSERAVRAISNCWSYSLR